MEDSDKEKKGSLFGDINALKKAKPDDPDADFAKLNNTIFARIVKNKFQEVTTLGVIVLNALFLGYDTDYSARWSRPDGLYNQGSRWGFPFMENFFCVYFTVEVMIRFFAFKRKRDCYKDAWFVFDSTLVIIMVVETWILEVIGADAMPIDMDMLRLLRLARIARMGKLMRFFPELAIIVKGMLAAVRSVGCTAILLILVMYVFSIIFTDAYHQGLLADDELDEGEGHGGMILFGSMGKSMRHLFIMGTILDDITACTNTIRSTEKATIMMTAFFVFVLVSSFTMLNMLIGILCEVVTATSEGERAKSSEAFIRESMGKLFATMDVDGSGTISRKEFMMMKDDKEVRAALQNLEVQTKHFDMYADLMFQDPDSVMDMDQTINMIMRLRPGSKVSALDFASFQQILFKNAGSLKTQISGIDRMICKYVAFDPDEEEAIANGSAVVMGANGITVEQVLTFSNEDILEELQKRVGNNSSGPADLDPSRNTPGMVQAFETLCIPQAANDAEAWSKETYTC